MIEHSFVGRSADLAFLHQQLKTVEDRPHKLLLLTASAGGGKTRLVEHFLAGVSDDCTIIRGRCWDNWAAVSYHSLREALRQLPVSANATHPHLRTFLCNEREDTANMISPQVLFPAIGDLLEQATALQPLILFLDDLQWADEGTLEWLDFCLHQQEELPLFLLAACRSEEFSGLQHFFERLQDARQQDRLLQRELAPLDRSEVAELAHTVAPTEAWNENAIEQIWHLSEGNPLLALENIRAHGDSAAPSTHSDPLRHRLQILPSETRNLLCQAAVIGECFGVESLATALNQDPLETARTLDDIWHAQHLIGPDGEGYRFAHARYREVLLESMSPALRRQYHARLAAQGNHIAPEQHTYHLVHSSDVRTGARALLKQGDDLRYRANYRDVLRFYTEALWHVQDQGNDDELLLEIYQRIGDLQLWAAHEPELARGYYEVALRWVQSPQQHALLLARLAETFFQPNNLCHIERALHFLGDGGPAPLRDWLEMRLLQTREVASLEQEFQFAERAQRVYEAEELPLELRLQAHSNYMWHSVRINSDPMHTLALYEEHAQLLPDRGWQTAHHYSNVSQACLGAGRPERALHYAQQARELFTELQQGLLAQQAFDRELVCYLFTHQFGSFRTKVAHLFNNNHFDGGLYAHTYEMLCKTWWHDQTDEGPHWAASSIDLMHYYVPQTASANQRTIPNEALHHLGAAERVLRRAGQKERAQQAISEHRGRLAEVGYDVDIVWYFAEKATRPPMAIGCDLADWQPTLGHARSEVLQVRKSLCFHALPLQGFVLLNMPRLTRRVSGDFTIECTVQSGSEVQNGIYESWRLKGEGKTNPMAVGAGGIVVIFNLREKLRLAAHVCEPSEVFMELRSGDQRWTPGRGLLDDDERPVRLRLERRGALFSAYAANEGDAQWYTCGQVELPHWGEVQVGLWGESPVDLYPAQTERAETRIWDIALECAEEMATTVEEEIQLLPEIRYADALPDFVAAAPATRTLLKNVQRAAQSELPALICGETGTGKELIARALHQCGPRKDGPYVPLNCAAIAPHLLESELFGHVRGAFTGAHQNRGGLFEAADEGILFLDEIGDASLELQARLLRVLEDREVRRVGATRAKKVDVRIVAATNRDLEKDIANGRFRRDLYYRLRGIELVLPPLRQRRADIAVLVAHSLSELARRRHIERPEITQRAMELLKNYDWPGNVRELLHEVERAAEAAEFAVIRSFHLAHLAPRSNAESQQVNSESEREQLVAALRTTGGNVKEAAEHLGISRNTIYRRLRRHQIDRTSI